jgi:hypothetical protein
MTEDFENQLRRALRPVDAPEGFAERLMQKLPPAAPREPVVVALPVRTQAPRSPQRRFGVPAALAASMVAAVLLGQQLALHRAERQEAEGRAASQELLQALRVTSQKLDLAYQAVKSPSRSAEPDATDEENRS